MSEEQLISPIKTEYNTVLFTKFFDKIPDWIRWIIAIPAAIICYLVIHAITYFGWFFYAGESFTEGYIGASYASVLFVVVPVIVIHDCVPKFKFVISIVLSVFYFALGLLSTFGSLISRPIPMTLDYFFASTLQGIIGAGSAVFLVVALVKGKYEK